MLQPSKLAHRRVSRNGFQNAATYLTRPPSKNFASSFLPVGASILKTARMEAKFKKRDREAKCSPGQILPEKRHIKDFSTVWME